METNEIQENDVVRLTKGDYISLGRVTAVSEDGVQIFRTGGDVWYLFDEYEVEKLGTALVDMY